MNLTKLTVNESTENRWHALQRGLRNMDSLFQNRYVRTKKEKETQKETIFNAYESGKGKGKGRGKGGKGKGKGGAPDGYCMGIVRKAKCTRRGCKYLSMQRDEYNNRPDCADHAKQGWCRRGAGCKYRHPGDEPKMTEELMKHCEHNGGGQSTNCAEEEGDVTGNV
jgi:hypothetical protein